MTEQNSSFKVTFLLKVFNKNLSNIRTRVLPFYVRIHNNSTSVFRTLKLFPDDSQPTILQIH